MNNEPEFNIIHIYLGTLVPIYIFNYLLEIIYQMFNNLGIVLAIIILIVCIKAGMIVYNEMKIWAKVT